MMGNPQKIVLILSIFPIIGAFVDKMLLARQKGTLHLLMVQWWNRLDDTKLPDLHRFIAKNTRKALRGAFRYNYSKLRKIFILVLVSWVFTSSAALIALYLDSTSLIVSESPQINLPIFTVYIVNLVFDVLAISITYYFLSVIELKSYVISIVVIILHIILSIILILACYTSLLFASTYAFNHSWLGTGVGNTLNRSSFVEDRKFMVIYKYYAIKFYKNEPILDENKEDYIHKNEVTEKLILNKLGMEWDELISQTLYHSTIKEYYNYRTIWKKFWGDITGKKRDYRSTIYFNTIFRLNEKIPISIKQMKVGCTTSQLGPSRSFPFMASTVFFPTLIYLLFLLFVVIAKVILSCMKFSIMHFLEVTTEQDPLANPKSFIPGTMIGLVFGIIAVIINLLLELIKTKG